MLSFQLTLYNLGIRLYSLGIFLASFFSAKAKLLRTGQKNWSNGVEKLDAYKGKRIWFHCASLGEFEQARPVIEKYGCENRNNAIVVTFFSPSGFEVRKNYESADFITYLPLDNAHNAKEFIELVKPDVALFVKYEFWYHFLHELKRRNIPVILFSAVFRKEQIFFKPYGNLFREMLGFFSKIFVQNEESQKLLSSIGISSEVAFDTRFDRVTEIANHRKEFPALEKFRGASKIFIAGSTWRKDEELILKCINNNVLKEYKYIIAPHQIEPETLSHLKTQIKARSCVLSELTEENAKETGVVIVDSIGNLSSLYYYADIAYIGGGFNHGIHNVLEAAVYGMPIFFGPNYKKSLEAIELEKLFTAFSVDSYKDLLYNLDTLTTGDQRRRIFAALKSKQYVKDNVGGTIAVFDCIKQFKRMD